MTAFVSQIAFLLSTGERQTGARSWGFSEAGEALALVEPFKVDREQNNSLSKQNRGDALESARKLLWRDGLGRLV